MSYSILRVWHKCVWHVLCVPISGKKRDKRRGKNPSFPCHIQTLNIDKKIAGLIRTRKLEKKKKFL